MNELILGVLSLSVTQPLQSFLLRVKRNCFALELQGNKGARP